MKKIILGVLIFVAVVPAFAADISHVSVRNKKFELIKVIEDKQALQNFEDIWKTRTKVKEPVNPVWMYKVDIGGKGHGDRWLYDPKGFVQVLSKVKRPIYQIPDAESFNKLIGTHNMPLEPSR